MRLQVTNAGIQAIAHAIDGGIKLVVTDYALADGYGYAIDPDQDAPRGEIQHWGVPSNYRVDTSNQVHYTCWADDTVGDFDYGEVCLYVRDENDERVLFAIGVMPYLQPKRRTTASVLGNVVSQDVILSVRNIAAAIEYNIQQLTEGKLLELGGIFNLLPPNNSPSNAYLMTDDTDDYNNPLYAFRENDFRWFFPTHSIRKVPGGITQSGTNTSVTSSMLDGISYDSSAPGTNVGRYIIQFTSGNLRGEARLCASITGGVASWTNTFGSAPAAGDQFVLYQSTLSWITELLGDYYTKPEVDAFLALKANLDSPDFTGTPSAPTPGLSDYSGRIANTRWVTDKLTTTINAAIAAIPNASTSVRGLMQVGQGLVVLPGSPVVQAHGLLHPGNPASGGTIIPGNSLTSAHNMNDGLASGVYAIVADGNRPANLPPGTTRGGRVEISNFNGHILQQFFPMSDGGAAGSPNMVPWWRIWNNTQGWSAWQIMGGGTVGASGTLTYLGACNNSSITHSTTKITTLTIRNSRSESHIYIYVNGTHVLFDDGEGGGGLSFTAPKGVSIQARHTGKSESCPVYIMQWD